MIVLPKKDKDGKYFVSYSQISAWNEEKGFNTGQKGKIEYIRKYFLNEKYKDDTGFALFGSEVEDYICNRGSADKFDTREKAVLEKIEPLGIFQKEFKLEFDGFYVWGFMDDVLPDLSKIRDYKTASKKSGEKYTKEDYYQLDLYAMAAQQITGKLPKDLEVCLIERQGNGFRGGRNVLSVAEDVWYVQRQTDEKRQEYLRNIITSTVKEISKYWEIFCELNKTIK